LKRNHNIETWTAINTNGVTVIDREKDVGVTSILPTYMYEKAALNIDSTIEVSALQV